MTSLRLTLSGVNLFPSPGTNLQAKVDISKAKKKIVISALKNAFKFSNSFHEDYPIIVRGKNFVSYVL